MILLLCATTFIGSVNAIAFKGPTATSRSEVASALFLGWAPGPTPQAQLIHSLDKRSSTVVGYSLENNTCGYIDGASRM